MKILCIEDDLYLAQRLQETLIKKHYQVEIAVDGKIGWDLVEIYAYDLILLDVMLPGIDGITLCQRLRGSSTDNNPNKNTPILLMTAMDEMENKVLGLDAGADDYLIKPFAMEELLARIRALLRRGTVEKTPVLAWGGLCLDPNKCEVTYQGEVVLLGAKEHELLELFLRNPERIFSSSQLLDRLWTSEQFPTEGAVRSHIKSLRKKLKKAGSGEILETIYKLGYRLIKQPEQEHSDPDTVNQAIASQEMDQSIKQSMGQETSSRLNFSDKLCNYWQKNRPYYYQHYLGLQEAIEMLSQGGLSLAQRRDAEGKAHLLIGSLGSFGFQEASQLARRMQQLLRGQQPINSEEINQLKSLGVKLEKFLVSHRQEPPAIAQETLTLITPSISTSYLLITQEDRAFANAIAMEAITWGVKTEIVTQLAQAQQYLAKHHPTLIIADLAFLETAPLELDFLSQIHAQYPHIPLVILSTNNSLTIRLEVAKLGSQVFLTKPISPFEVLSIVSQIGDVIQLNQSRLLVVDDDPLLLELIRYLLEPQGYQVITLDRPYLFWETLEEFQPDLLILDIEFYDQDLSLRDHPSSQTKKAIAAVAMAELNERGEENPIIPGLNGINLCRIIRNDPRWHRLPIIFLSAHDEPEVIQQAISVGADSFLSKPVVEQELITHIQSRLQQRKLWEITDNDELTGISLRRKFLQDLNRLIGLAKRQKQPLSLAILDLDLFKRINDQYGHAMGDQVLRYLGKLLSQSFRQEDVVGRWGGEEFIIGMYGSHKYNNQRRLMAINQQLSEHQFFGRDGQTFQMTFSCGIAQFPEDGEELQTLYRAADLALYQAKQQGRNQILLASSPLPSLKTSDRQPIR